VPLEWKILSRREVKTIDRTQLTVLDWCHEFSNHDKNTAAARKPHEEPPSFGGTTEPHARLATE